MEDVQVQLHVFEAKSSQCVGGVGGDVTRPDGAERRRPERLLEIPDRGPVPPDGAGCPVAAVFAFLEPGLRVLRECPLLRSDVRERCEVTAEAAGLAEADEYSAVCQSVLRR